MRVSPEISVSAELGGVIADRQFTDKYRFDVEERASASRYPVLEAIRFSNLARAKDNDLSARVLG